MLDLDAIQARADAATPGPWHWEGDYPRGRCPHPTEWTHHGPDLRNPEDLVAFSSGYDADDLFIENVDAEFIAAARTDVPALVAELRAARKVIEAARVEQFDHTCGLPEYHTPGFCDLCKAMAVYDNAIKETPQS